jgi:4-hydroxybenzoate polyprenyltransferase
MRVKAIDASLDHVTVSNGKWIEGLWKEIRPWQWIKNLFVFTPLLFSQKLFISKDIVHTLVAFVLFCLISSSIYLLNDIRDCAQDRQHPQKRRRPLAAGELSVKVAVLCMLALLVCSLTGGVLLREGLGVILCGYWVLNLLYCLWLKHQVILDVFVIAAGFVLRVMAGAVAIEAHMSPWLLVCTTLLALFLGFCKRRHELVLLGEHAAYHRQVLGEYSPRFLDMMISIVTTSTVMSYAFYTVSESTVQKFHTRGLLLTLPFVLYGICRYLYLVYHKGQGGEPSQCLLTDAPLLINLCLWACTAGVIVFWQ